MLLCPVASDTALGTSVSHFTVTKRLHGILAQTNMEQVCSSDIAVHQDSASADGPHGDVSAEGSLG